MRRHLLQLGLTSRNSLNGLRPGFRRTLTTSQSRTPPASHTPHTPQAQPNNHNNTVSKPHQSLSPSPSPKMLPPSDDPLVWIDCEMTGLDPTTDVILQIVCFITTSSLQLVEPHGLELIIHHPPSTLDAMGPWCQDTHSKTGLTSRVTASTTTPESAAQQLLEYITRHVTKPRTALLAGNSIHADRAFLARMCPKVLEHLHYRLVDVSTIKECLRRWGGPAARAGVPAKKELHEARMDVLESIEEMKYYKRILFDHTAAQD